MNASLDSIAPLRDFVVAMTGLVSRTSDEPTVLKEGKPLLAKLLSRDDWLPAEFARPDPSGYKQYLLYCDPLERFSVVSFVWSPGHRTPIHDHMVWGMVGVLRGIETCREYQPQAGDKVLDTGIEHTMTAGMIDCVSPTIGDWHVVSNTSQDTAISIHVYGGNIGAVRRHVFDPQTQARKTFISGYTLPHVPNLWDKSAAMRAAA